MPYKIIWEPQGVIKYHFGVVTGIELMQAVVATEADERFDNIRYVINDFLDCTGLSVSGPEVEEIAAIDEAASINNPNIRIAVVTTLPEVVAIATQYGDSTMNAYPTRIFTSMDAARQWLNSPNTIVMPYRHYRC
jgi:hypothetical protein